VDADLDTLATALYVKTDDLLKAGPQWAPARPRVGISPHLTDAELVTLAVMQALLGFTSEARWLRHARSQPRTVVAGRPNRAAIGRCPTPDAFAANAAPITSTPSQRRSRHDTTSNTCVTRHTRHLARRGRSTPTPRTTRGRA